MTRSGRFALIEQFLADGLDHMFGNPGTVEQGFLDALREYPAMKYVLTLQETVAVIVGDGYRLLEALRRDAAAAWLWQDPAVEVLRRVWLAQFYLDDGRVRWRTAADWRRPVSGSTRLTTRRRPSVTSGA